LVGPLESSLHHDEIALSAFFPALAAGAGVAFEEIARRHGDYALCGVAALVTDDTVHAGYLSVCDVPTVVDLTGVADGDLGDAALEHLDPGDDIHASAAYRAQLVRVLTARVVAAARRMAQMEAAQ
jgi:carbon-monoxide dehydrogenase medium subunit